MMSTPEGLGKKKEEGPQSQSSKRKVVRTTCPLCNYHVLDVEIENNQVMGVRAAPVPGNKGDGVCLKAVHALRWHYPEQARGATYPMIRKSKGAVITDEELITFCKKHIAGYKTPKSVEFVDALPKNAAGKILKRELRERCRQEQARKA